MRTACSALQHNATPELNCLIDRRLCLMTHLSLYLWKVAMTNNKQWKGDKHELHNSLRTANWCAQLLHKHKRWTFRSTRKTICVFITSISKNKRQQHVLQQSVGSGGWGGHTVRQDCSRPIKLQRAAICNVTWVSCGKLWGFLNPRTRWNDTTAVEHADGDTTESHLQSLFQRMSESMKNE
jgi:hypothetical protein